MEDYDRKDLVCRTCMSENCETTTIFATHNFDVIKGTICDALVECASIQVFEGDGLPEQMCTKCIEELRRALRFRKLCEKTDTILKLQFMVYDEFEDISCDLEDNSEKVFFENSNDVDLNIANLKQEIQDTVPSEEINGTSNGCGNLQDMVKVEDEGVQFYPKKTYNCEQCKIGYDRLSSYEFHLKRKHKISDDEESHECKICSSVFPTLMKLKNHVKTHTSEWNCDVCSMNFSSKGNLKKHQVIHGGKKKFKCPKCGLRFLSRYDLTRHERLHAGERPYLCTICGSGFTTNANLQAHLVVHADTRPFVCDMCDVGFTSKYNLKVHRVQHTGEKPYKCRICPWSTAIVSSLKTHEKRHKDDFPYKCDACTLGFTTTGSLNKHLNKHQVEFKCTVCTYGFGSKEKLQVHSRVHTAIKDIKCDLCDSEFTTKTALIRHQAKVCINVNDSENISTGNDDVTRQITLCIDQSLSETNSASDMQHMSI